MCACTPAIRTPWCGKPNCQPPAQRRAPMVCPSCHSGTVHVGQEFVYRFSSPQTVIQCPTSAVVMTVRPGQFVEAARFIVKTLECEACGELWHQQVRTVDERLAAVGAVNV